MNKIVAIGVMCLVTAPVAANDGIYTQVQVGMDFFGKPIDGDWQQQTHDSHSRFHSWDANAGIGYRKGNFSLEGNYRFLNGGQMDSILEFDTTYFGNGDHTPVQRTISLWYVKGPSVDVLYHVGNAYLRYGTMWQELSWTINVQSLKDPDSHSVQTISDKQRRPLLGIGYDFNRWNVEATYYDIGGGRGQSAVNKAATLNVGFRF